MERKRIRGRSRLAGSRTPARPEAVERGRRVVEDGARSAMSRRAFEALMADLEAAELVPEWMVDRVAINGRVDGTPAPPSVRQIEFAQGYANGESATEIATRLGVRMETVSRGLDRLKYNLGARSRYQAVAMLVYAGYVSAPSLPRYARQARGVTAHRLAGGLARSDDGAVAALSATERATLALLVEGLTNDEIAAEVGLSAEAVKSQVRMILRKLDARNRTHLVSAAFRLGLVS